MASRRLSTSRLSEPKQPRPKHLSNPLLSFLDTSLYAVVHAPLSHIAHKGLRLPPLGSSNQVNPLILQIMVQIVTSPSAPKTPSSPAPAAMPGLAVRLA